MSDDGLTSYRSVKLRSLVTLVLALPAGATLAAEAVLEEIVVSARKREETLQDAPLTVTAFSSRAIEAAGLRTLEDISSFSPGMFYSNQGGQRGGRDESVLRFRGMDINDVSPVRALASVFIDGVYLAGGLGALSFENVERVEVIKGPQSAYFGRTTFGGAVNVITRDPGDALAIDSRLVVAEDGEYDVSAAVEGGIIGGKLAARLSARYYSADGRFRSVADGGRLGEQETTSAGLTLVGRPSENLSLRLRGFVQEDEDGPPATFALTRDLHNCGPFVTGGVTYFCGKLPEVKSFGTNTVLEGVAYDIYVNNSRNAAGLARGPKLDHVGMRRQLERASLEIEWDMGGTGTVLTSVSGFNSIEQRRILDLDFTPQNIWLEGSFQDIEDWGQELRLSGGNDRWTWLLGLSYFNLTFETPNGSIGYLYPNASFPNGFFLNQTIGKDDVTTRAVFGSVSWKFAEDWTLSLEGRYQEDKIDEGQVAGIALEKTFSSFLPRVILQWQPVEGTNLYAIYAEGNKPGDFNNSIIPLTEAQKEQVFRQTGATEFVGEEELKNYELGLKQLFLDGRASLNLAAYFMDWTNQQTRTTTVIQDPSTPAGIRTLPVIVAAGETDLWGLELEGSLQANELLTFSATFNWAASEYQDFNCGFCARVTGEAQQAGNQSPRFPEFSGTASISLADSMANGWGWFGRLDAVYTGKAYDEAFNLSYAPEALRVNLRGGLENDNWRLELFVTNVFDEDNYEAAARFTDFTKGNFNLNDFVVNVTPADPRQFGLRIDYRL